MTGVFDMAFEDLPQEIPLFPLPRVLLLPRALLPLNIFEPRYLSMIEDALKGDRLIGMVQPKPDRDGKEAPLATFQTGCAGRITAFEETEDGRYLVTLKGVCRFDIVKELSSPNGYRRVAVDWMPYAGDTTEDTTTDVCRDNMIDVLRQYFEKMDMQCDKMDNVRTIGCEKLIATLSMVCPFGVTEKQALLEAPTLKERADILRTLLCMATQEGDDAASRAH